MHSSPTTSRPTIRRAGRLYAGLAAIFAARLLAFWLFPLCAEDAYISYHAGIDPAWRAATTSPLWSLLCAAADPPTVARLLSLVADCVAVWAAWRVLGVWGYWTFLALWVSPFFTGSAVSGLETHAVAACLLVARVWPVGYFLAACLRPDAAAIALVASGKRWRYALAGFLMLLGVGLLFCGHALPQTMASKALVYGIHPGDWTWLAPREFDFLSIAVGIGCAVALLKQREGHRPPWLYVTGAVAFLLAHVAFGSPHFWWWAVPPFAMLSFVACESIRRPWHLVIALACLALFAGRQWHALTERTEREAQLWHAGEELAKFHPRGTVLLEPAGMIPYQNRNLRVIDDVGLLEPWMAWRRKLGRGWRTDALNLYKPRWLIMRMREYVYPDGWIVGQPSFYDSTDAKLPDYGLVSLPGVTYIGQSGQFKTKMVSSNLVILMRKPLTPHPK